MNIGTVRFDRMELAGSLGDLGTLLPLAAGMIIINGLSSQGLFLCVGLFYILAGLYYKVPVSVQPMKVIGAFAVAEAVSPQVIHAAGLLMALTLLVVGGLNIIKPLARVVPRAVIRGVQASTGILLAVRGLEYVLGRTASQAVAVEPQLLVQHLGPLPMSMLLGAFFGLLTLLLLDNKKLPAGLVVVAGGMAAGLALGAWRLIPGIEPSLYLPRLLPSGWPTTADFLLAATVMALPQAPMTIGNAVIANADTSLKFYPEGVRVTPRALCLSMALANVGSAALGGMPMCHGAGGLAAHYRFGARTAGSNFLVGGMFVILAMVFGPHALTVMQLLPLSVLGVLLLFAGLELALTILDLTDRPGLFVSLLMVALTFTAGLTAAFVIGLVLALALSTGKLSV